MGDRSLSVGGTEVKCIRWSKRRAVTFSLFLTVKVFHARHHPHPLDSPLSLCVCVNIFQCLKYANGDVIQATKLCIKLCEFRLAEGWDLVISAPELQGPLRSRVHTLTDQRDR